MKKITLLAPVHKLLSLKVSYLEVLWIKVIDHNKKLIVMWNYYRTVLAKVVL